VDRAVRVDGAGGGHQRLAENLSAEHPLPALVAPRAQEQVVLEPLQIERGKERVERALRRGIVVWHKASRVKGGRFGTSGVG
jgi:hypothetical protein